MKKEDTETPAINPKLIMRIPLISGVNDSEEDIQIVSRSAWKSSASEDAGQIIVKLIF